MKNKLNIIFLSILIIFVLLISFYFFGEKKKNDLVSIDIKEQVIIDNNKLNVIYKNGKKVDKSITYGNKIIKYIELENISKEDISFALQFKNSIISNDSVTYNLSYSDSYDKQSFISIIENEELKGDTALGFNMGINKNSNLILKVEFISSFEGEKTKIEGLLEITNNLSDKDIFVNNIKDINNQIEEKIEKNNGIGEQGVFVAYLNDLDTDYKGFVIIDAKDIANIKYIDYIFNNTYMINGNKNIKKSSITNNDNSINNIDPNGICNKIAKTNCTNINDLSFNKKGSKKDFVENTKDIIKKVEKINNSNKVMIYDVEKDIDNNTDIKGYILVNNTDNKKDFYLYLTNYTYMISGYNYTKLGDYSKNTAVRTYVDTAFALSSKDYHTVCTFSGFSECYNKNMERV